MRHFLQYWKVQQADENSDKPLEHTASAQFEKVSAGDVLWIVTIRNHHLKLLGRLHVAKLVSQQEAERHFNDEALYEAQFHAIAKDGTVEKIREIETQDLAIQLRFNSDRDRLTLARPGRTDGKQLQSIRELTNESVALLEARWNKEGTTVRNPPWSRDEVILALDTYFQNNPLRINKDHAAVIELSTILNELGERLGKKVSSDFRNPNGAYMKLCNFLHLDPAYEGTGLSSVSTMDRAIWEEYSNSRDELRALAASIRSTIASSEELAPASIAAGEEEEFPEGALKFRQHTTRERNRELVRKAKNRAKILRGRLDCEICGFNFTSIYGVIGEDFIECHHTIPVSKLIPNSKTRIEDVALLCANCHRMVHRRRPWLRIQELRSLLQSKTAAIKPLI